MRWNGMIIANMEFISVIGMAPTIYVDAVKVVSEMLITELICLTCSATIQSLATTTAVAARGRSFLFQCSDCAKLESE